MDKPMEREFLFKNQLDQHMMVTGLMMFNTELVPRHGMTRDSFTPEISLMESKPERVNFNMTTTSTKENLLTVNSMERVNFSTPRPRRSKRVLSATISLLKDSKYSRMVPTMMDNSRTQRCTVLVKSSIQTDQFS